MAWFCQASASVAVAPRARSISRSSWAASGEPATDSKVDPHFKALSNDASNNTFRNFSSSLCLRKESKPGQCPAMAA